MNEHTIIPTRQTLHGHFSPDLPPILHIESGETVVFQTLDSRWAVAPRTSARYEDFPQTFPARDSVLDAGHALCGPVFVNGAMPGTTLEIAINEIVPGTWGWTGGGGWPHPVNERLGLVEDGAFLLWAIDKANQTATDQDGHRVKIAPFMGVMGMPPAEKGIHPTPPPRMTGGNLDCKELTSGSSLFLPVAVPGGLFSCGDGHAAQGDGESSVTAIECPMERVSLTFHVHNYTLKAPRAWTPAAWITFGLHEDLQEATYLALENMLDLMQAQKPGLSRGHALALASVVVDLRITQIVNGVRGVHAILRHDAIV